MARARRTTKSSSSVKVNFQGVESRKNPAEGDYICEVLEAKTGKSSNGNDQIEFVTEISKGENKGYKGYLYCPLADNSLWKLHAFLTALGEDVPEDEMDIDLSDLVGKEFVGVFSHETFNGKKRAKLTDFDTVDNYTGDSDKDDEKEEKSSKKDKKGGKDKKSKKLAKAAVEKLDRDELEELITEHDLDVDADSKKLKKDDDALTAAVLEALEEKDLLEEEEETPKKGAKGKDKKGDKKKPKKYDKDEVDDMDEDELEEVIKASGIDVDLDDYKKLPKKVAAVIKALDAADLLDE